MKVRFLIQCVRDETMHWDYVPQKESLYFERVVDIPDLPKGWAVWRVAAMREEKEDVQLQV